MNTMALENSEVLALHRLQSDYMRNQWWSFGDSFNASMEQSYPNPCINDPGWKGVNCSCTASVCHITHLDLHGIHMDTVAYNVITDILLAFPYLISLNLNQNYLRGNITSINVKNSSLTHLYLADNHLAGSLPTTWLCDTSLEEVHLQQNRLSGSDVFSNSTNNLSCLNKNSKLKYLDISFNRITGELLLLFGDLTNFISFPELQVLKVSNNCLNSKSIITKLSISFCSSKFQQTNFINLKSLEMNHLYVESKCSTWLKDNEFYKWWRSNVISAFHSKDLSISFPSCIIHHNESQLVTLSLAKNGLFGSISSGNLTRTLRELDISNNYLFGTIPLSLQYHHENGTGWSTLRLNNNHFMGSLSSVFFHANQRNRIDLSNNELSGLLPPFQLQNTQLLKNNRFACFPQFSIASTVPKNDLSFLPINDPLYNSYSCLFALPLTLNSHLSKNNSHDDNVDNAKSLLLLSILLACFVCFWCVGVLRYEAIYRFREKKRLSPNIDNNNSIDNTNCISNSMDNNNLRQKQYVRKIYSHLDSLLLKWRNWLLWLGVVWCVVWMPCVFIVSALVQRVNQSFLLQLCVFQWSGYPAAVIVGVFWCLVTLLYVCFPYYMNNSSNNGNSIDISKITLTGGADNQHIALIKDNIFETIEQHSNATKLCYNISFNNKHGFCTNVYDYSVQWLNTSPLWIPVCLMSLMLHMCYVYFTTSYFVSDKDRVTTEGMVLVSQCVLAVLMYLFNQIVTPLLVMYCLPYFITCRDTLYMHKYRREITLFLVLFSTIVSPIVAVVMCHRQCLLPVIWTENEMYLSDNNPANSDVLDTDDDMIYDFQCSNSFFDSYVIVLVFLYLMDLLMIPLLQGMVGGVSRAVSCLMSTADKTNDNIVNTDVSTNAYPWDRVSWMEKQSVEMDMFYVRQELGFSVLVIWGVACPCLGILVISCMICDTGAFQNWKFEDMVEIVTPPRSAPLCTLKTEGNDAVFLHQSNISGKQETNVNDTRDNNVDGINSINNMNDNKMKMVGNNVKIVHSAGKSLKPKSGLSLFEADQHHVYQLQAQPRPSARAQCRTSSSSALVALENETVSSIPPKNINNNKNDDNGLDAVQMFETAVLAPKNVHSSNVDRIDENDNNNTESLPVQRNLITENEYLNKESFEMKDKIRNIDKETNDNTINAIKSSKKQTPNAATARKSGTMSPVRKTVSSSPAKVSPQRLNNNSNNNGRKNNKNGNAMSPNKPSNTNNKLKSTKNNNTKSNNSNSPDNNKTTTNNKAAKNVNKVSPSRNTYDTNNKIIPVSQYSDTLKVEEVEDETPLDTFTAHLIGFYHTTPYHSPRDTLTNNTNIHNTTNRINKSSTNDAINSTITNNNVLALSSAVNSVDTTSDNQKNSTYVVSASNTSDVVISDAVNNRNNRINNISDVSNMSGKKAKLSKIKQRAQEKRYWFERERQYQRMLLEEKHEALSSTVSQCVAHDNSPSVIADFETFFENAAKTANKETVSFCRQLATIGEHICLLENGVRNHSPRRSATHVYLVWLSVTLFKLLFLLDILGNSGLLIPQNTTFTTLASQRWPTKTHLSQMVPIVRFAGVDYGVSQNIVSWWSHWEASQMLSLRHSVATHFSDEGSEHIERDTAGIAVVMGCVAVCLYMVMVSPVVQCVAAVSRYVYKYNKHTITNKHSDKIYPLSAGDEESNTVRGISAVTLDKVVQSMVFSGNNEGYNNNDLLQWFVQLVYKHCDLEEEQ